MLYSKGRPCKQITLMSYRSQLQKLRWTSLVWRLIKGTASSRIWSGRSGAMTVPSAHEFHWQSLASLSSARVYHSLADVGGQLYMVGGCDGSARPTSALERYSPEVDRWISLCSMPTPRAGAAVAVLGKQLLVVGGMGKDQRPLKAVEVYNTDEGKWRKRCSLREASMGLAVTVRGRKKIWDLHVGLKWTRNYVWNPCTFL